MVAPGEQPAAAHAYHRAAQRPCVFDHPDYDDFGLSITGVDMTLRQLEILRALIRHRTTVAAAADLALSQPAVSNALKIMEAQAGFVLFHRVNNRLFPSAEALALHEEGETIF